MLKQLFIVDISGLGLAAAAASFPLQLWAPLDTHLQLLQSVGFMIITYFVHSNIKHYQL